MKFISGGDKMVVSGIIGIFLGGVLFITAGCALEKVYEIFKGEHRKLRRWKYVHLYILSYLTIASLIIFSWELLKMGISTLELHFVLPFLGKIF